MSKLMFDTLTVDGIRKTKDGYLACVANVARTGIQTYHGWEVGKPSMETVRVYRPPEEVFDKAAMASMAHRPVTLDHPDETVTADNWKKYAKGHTGDEVIRDGQHVRIPMVLMDRDAIKAFQNGKARELSMGYSTELKWEAGKTEDGQPYDAVQTEIRANHLALVPAARGGATLKFGDGKTCPECGEPVDPDDDTCDDCGATWTNDRDFTAAERKSAAESGAAMPDGSFPIRNTSDLKNAIHAIGRASDPAAAKRHIIKRAKALGATNELPSDWAGSTADSASKGTKVMTKLTIDGIPVELDEVTAGIVNNKIKALSDACAKSDEEAAEAKKKAGAAQDSLTALQAKHDTLAGQNAVLAKNLEDAKVTPEKLDAMVAERAAVCDAAKPLVGNKYAFAGKDIATIRRDAVTAALGDTAKNMSDASIEGAFLALGTTKKPSGTDRLADDVNRPGYGYQQTMVADARDVAHAEMVKHLQEAHKH